MTTRVDFYLLSEANPQSRWTVACRLSEKAYQKRHKIYILTASTQESNQFDELLWTFRDDSFIPHEIYQPGKPLAPIQLGHFLPSDWPPDILINLTDSAPDNIQLLQRIIEVVAQDQKSLAKGRELFRYYRALGCQLESVKI